MTPEREKSIRLLVALANQRAPARKIDFDAWFAAVASMPDIAFELLEVIGDLRHKLRAASFNNLPTSKRVIEDMIRYNNTPGCHTYSLCPCGRGGGRRGGPCNHCLCEILSGLTG